MVIAALYSKLKQYLKSFSENLIFFPVVDYNYSIPFPSFNSTSRNTWRDSCHSDITGPQPVSHICILRHSLLFTTQEHGGASLNGWSPPRQHEHIDKDTFTHTFILKTRRIWRKWLWWPDGVRGPFGPKGSWHLSHEIRSQVRYVRGIRQPYRAPQRRIQYNYAIKYLKI